MSSPDPDLKGADGGNCNRTACQQPGAVWFNESTRKYYCCGCAVKIQQAENDFRNSVNQPPVIMFEGIFDPSDKRHKR